MVKLGAILSLGLLGLAQAAPTQKKVKIMPFGASIVGAPGCWRAQLWKKLDDDVVAGTKLSSIVDFVGSNKAPDCGFAYDGENEGHAGALATDYAKNGDLVKWLDAARPDIVLMHLGTNDVLNNKKTEDIIAAYNTLIGQMRKSKTDTRIIVSLLIPIDQNKFKGAQAGLDNLNKALISWGKATTTRESPIVIVDNAKDFDPAKDTRDGEHPNASGDLKMANKFYPPTREAILSVSADALLQDLSRSVAARFGF